MKPQDYKYWEERPINDPKQDWIQASTWIDGYTQSLHHPHRYEIVKELVRLAPFRSLLELGCNTGPNLRKVKTSFPQTRLVGIDANIMAVAEAQSLLPEADIFQGDINDLGAFKDFDIVLADAVLMYVAPEQIQNVAQNVNRIAKHGIILVEWDADSLLGEVKDFHWARDYKTLFEQFGWKGEKRKLTKDHWPAKNWVANGYIYTFRK